MKIANLRAARIVSDLTIVFAVCPRLVDADFASDHSRLRKTEYFDHYRRLGSPSVTIQASLIRPLQLERMIDGKYQAGQPAHVEVEDLVQAKDFVVSLTDSRARSLHCELFSE